MGEMGIKNEPTGLPPPVAVGGTKTGSIVDHLIQRKGNAWSHGFTLTLYCHEQLLPNGQGFHAQLPQLIHGKREECLYVHGMM